MLLILFANLLASSLVYATSPPCPQGSVADPFFGGCYTLSNQEFDFWSAEAQCQLLKGDLVSISGGAQNALLSNALKKWNVSDSIWIGLTGVLSGDKSWEWLDRSPVVYTNWIGGAEPKPAFPNTCAQLDQTHGFWSAMNCFTRMPFVCSVPSSDQPQTSTPTPSTTTKNEQITSTQIPTTTKGLCASGWSHFNDHCYKVISDDRYYNQTWAVSTCQRYASELASIHSTEENNFILDLADADPNRPCSIFIGLERSNSTSRSTGDLVVGDFYWRDHTPVDYTNWFPQYSNSFYRAQMATNQVLEYGCGWTTNGTWFNTSPSGAGVICKL